MRKAIAIDFDGCLCTNEYPAIGQPNWAVINRAKAEQRRGAGLILWTCREGDLLEAAVDACWDWGLAFDAINESLPDWIKEFQTTPRKVGASEYWDDKAVQMPAPNPPLTLDEYQRLKGDPVWIVPLGDDPDWTPQWIVTRPDYLVVNSLAKENRAYILQGNEDYGKTWLAYRRKPEEGS